MSKVEHIKKLLKEEDNNDFEPIVSNEQFTNFIRKVNRKKKINKLKWKKIT